MIQFFQKEDNSRGDRHLSHTQAPVPMTSKPDSKQGPALWLSSIRRWKGSEILADALPLGELHLEVLVVEEEG